MTPTTGDLAPFRLQTINLTADVDSLAEGIHSVNMLVSWPGGSGVVVSATVNKAGNPPQILRPACATVPSTNFSGYRIAAQVTDDFGLLAWSVDYTNSDDSSGERQWCLRVACMRPKLSAPWVSYTITAKDQAATNGGERDLRRLTRPPRRAAQSTVR